ncbi:MAG: aminotransferase class V-fold PLP-dependent enzyme [Ruminococcaceae bacterium]|nr:aminotransferase class V-fold PLP-dependent enzyme [Oscillospiraceae bacterium]
MVYLDNAATSFPKPKSVIYEVERCMSNYCGNPGRGSHRLALASSKKIYQCREEAAALFHSDSPENIVFTQNTTYALNIAINAFAKRYSHVIVSNMDHNSVLRPVYALASQNVSYSIFNAFGTEDEIIKEIRSLIRPNTKMLICSHSSNVCSRTLPVERIAALCQEKNITFILDAAQSAGIWDVDIRYADAICAPGHKALYGPQGTGILLFSDKYKDISKNLSTLISGGGGINSSDRDMPSFLPERFEGGTLNTPGIAGLYEGIKTVRRLGLDTISEHETYLGNRLRYMLLNSSDTILYDPEIKEGGTVLFNKRNVSPIKVSEELDKAGICVRGGFHCAPLAHNYLKTGADGAVRVSFGIFNSLTDAECLIRKLREIV